MEMVTLALLTAIALQDPSAPQVDRDCLDNNLTDRCAAETRAEVRRRLGTRSIEEEAASGAEIYRAYYVDGYGRDLVSVSYERRPGQSPEVVVYGFDGQVMRAAISAELWRDVRDESWAADRQLAEITDDPQRPSGRPVLCLHAWVSTVEMANSEIGRYRTEPVRRRTEDTCGGGLTTRYAYALADWALDAIQPCAMLNRERGRSTLHLLGACMALEGDRMAAAELRNARETFGPARGADQTNAGTWRAAIGTNGSPRLEWAGEVVQTERGRDNAVAEFVAGRMQALPSLRFYQQRFEGQTSKRGTIWGQAVYTQDDTRYQANYTQTWVWDPSLMEWMLADWTVEPFEAQAD